MGLHKASSRVRRPMKPFSVPPEAHSGTWGGEGGRAFMRSSRTSASWSSLHADLKKKRMELDSREKQWKRIKVVSIYNHRFQMVKWT